MLAQAESDGKVVGADKVLAAHRTTALRVCAEFPDFGALLTQERRRAHNRRVACKADVRPVNFVPVAPLTHKAQRRCMCRNRQRGGRPLDAERQHRQDELRFCDWMNYGLPVCYGEEGEQELSRLQVRVALPDGRLDLSRRYYCGVAGRAMELGERCAWSTAAVPPQLGSLNANGKEGPACTTATLTMAAVCATGAVPP